MRSLFLLALLANSSAFAAIHCAEAPKQLAEMVKTDQAVREEGMLQNKDPATSATAREETMRRWAAIDAANLATMKELLATCGWPVEKQASHNAWLLVQHADSDIAFQRKAKLMLAEAVKKGTASGGDLAYLSDRIAAAEGRPQEYGTQFKQSDRCTLVLAPSDDIARVNKRRRDVGLEPVAAYLEGARKRFMPADCK